LITLGIKLCVPYDGRLGVKQHRSVRRHQLIYLFGFGCLEAVLWPKNNVETADHISTEFGMDIMSDRKLFDHPIVFAMWRQLHKNG